MQQMNDSMGYYDWPPFNDNFNMAHIYWMMYELYWKMVMIIMPFLWDRFGDEFIREHLGRHD